MTARFSGQKIYYAAKFLFILLSLLKNEYWNMTTNWAFWGKKSSFFFVTKLFHLRYTKTFQISWLRDKCTSSTLYDKSSYDNIQCSCIVNKNYEKAISTACKRKNWFLIVISIENPSQRTKVRLIFREIEMFEWKETRQKIYRKKCWHFYFWLESRLLHLTVTFISATMT